VASTLAGELGWWPPSAPPRGQWQSQPGSTALLVLAGAESPMFSVGN
jgi:hypothetical protein